MHDHHAVIDVADESIRFDDLRQQLLCHPLYESVKTADSLRIFMREHAFAVWDFMSLLKRLQQLVTCCDVPWIPRTDATICRFINEIVLGEECDEDGRGGYASHFELYLEAMDEVGADAGPVRSFVSQLAGGIHYEKAIQSVPILPCTREFVLSTMQLTVHGQPCEVAAAFYYGREDVIPDMFSRLVTSLPREHVCVERLVHYLNRHIELDANDHGPLARKLVNRLAGDDPQRVHLTGRAACQSIQARIQLWNGVLESVRQI